MTKEDLADWIQAHDCEFQIIEGLNTTGWSVKAVNKKHRNRYIYLQGPFDEREVPDFFFRKACIDLWIDYPDCLKT